MTLSHIKGVADRRIDFPDEGIVVVEGQNEAGKTTMIEALDLLLDEKDSSKKRHVLAMRPVGLDVSSAVEAEISSGPYRFTYRKQWFRKPSTVLTVHAPRLEQLTGSAAHDRVREILAETTDANLWSALRLMQATPLTATDLSESAALSTALDEAAGQAGSAGGEGDSLVEAAEAVYREFFTATGRPTGAYREAEIRLESARTSRQEAAAAVHEVAEDVARHASAVGEVDRLAAQLDATDAAAAELREQWEASQQVVREAESLATRTAVARQAYEAASEAVRRRSELADEVTRSAGALAGSEEELATCRADVDPRESSLAAALAAAEQARSRQRAARRAASGAESDLALVGDLADLVELGARLRRLEEALDRRRAARDAARAARFDGSLTRLEAAERALDIARAEWRAGSPTWRIAPVAGVDDTDVEVVVDGRRNEVGPGLDGVVGGPVRIEVPGLIEVSIEPAVGANERAEVVARAERVLAELLAEAGVPDLAAARAAAGRAAEAEVACADAEAEVAAVLGASTVDALRDRGERLHAHVVELVTRRREATVVAGGPGSGAGGSDDPTDAGDVTSSTPATSPVASAQEATSSATSIAVLVREPGMSTSPAFDVLIASSPAEVTAESAARITAWILATVGGDSGAAGRAPVAAHGMAPSETVGAHDPGAGARAGADRPASAPVPMAESGPVLRAVAAQARVREADAEAAIAAADAEVEAVRAGVEAARLRVARAEVAVESARCALAAVTERLTRAREHEGDDLLSARVVDARAALEGARAQEVEVAAEVARLDPDSLRVRLEGAVSAASSMRRRFSQARDDKIEIEARLRHAGEQGRADRLAEAESDVARAERSLAALRRRAEAARTLYETLTRHRDEVRSTYVAPFGRAVSRLGRVVYGPDFDVEIGPGLTIDARLLGEERIPYEALSSGAKEQMSILARLACASLVDPRQGAPVILDDAMGYSDPERLQRVCAAFSLVGGGAQIILLTCTPGRYAAIPDAHVIQV
ncbi:AAA family ATPase [Mobilicoccus sp.]|uniref:AAA family ATPase n=1 Tax=Mobilicoccus sp. TaxID=2034349 RepID=UPI002897F999|nr:AAA family ATPase [Mobilicoccus sp.]